MKFIVGPLMMGVIQICFDGWQCQRILSVDLGTPNVIMLSYIHSSASGGSGGCGVGVWVTVAFHLLSAFLKHKTKKHISVNK